MRILVVLLALAGCAKKPPSTVDPSLPERRDTVEAGGPAEILQAAVDDEEPGPRGRALEILLAEAPPDALARLALRGTWDPEPWVQRRVIRAVAARLPEPAARAILHDFVRRTDGIADPYARALAGDALTDDPELPALFAAAWRAERLPWRAAPLQLAAARRGDAAATEAHAPQIEEADIGMEPAFVLDIGRSGLTALLPAFAAAWPWVEEDIRLAVAAARLLLGDPEAEKLWREALSSDDELAVLEGLDFLTSMDHPAVAALLQRVKGDIPLAQRYADLAIQARGDGPDRSFEAAIDDPDPEIRALAVRFAGEALGRPDLAPKAARIADKVVSRGLSDPSHAVRLAALRAARKAPDATVRALLTDELIEIRIEAARLATR